MVLEMLCFFESDHHRERKEYIQVLTYAYNKGVHSSTRATNFELVLSRTPRDLDIYHNIEDFCNKAWKGNEYWVMKIASTVDCAKLELKKAQVN